MDAWSWQEDSYRLDSESPLVISQSFWQDLSQTEATSRSLFASASPPVRAAQAQPFPFGLPTADAELCPESVAGALRGTSRTKRRRMLCFPGSKTELGCESQCGSGMNEGYTVAEEYEASTWFLGSGPDEESGAPCCEKWVDRCLGDTRDPCDRTRNFLDDSSAHSQQQLSLYSSSSHGTSSCCQYDQPDGRCMNEGRDSMEVSQGSGQQQQLQDCKESRESDDVTGLRKKLEVVPLHRASGNESQDCLSPTGAAGSESEIVLGPVTPLSSRPPSTSGAGRSRKSKSMAAPTTAAAVPVVAYPFAVLKPSGAQGDVTLNDINRRISRSPCSAAGGGGAPRRKKKGSSSSSSSSCGGPPGTAVVALTKIHTEGKGTITIIRSRAPL